MESVDIIIPVYNEEKTIEDILKAVSEADFCGLKKNIIIVDDCSVDSTREILKKYENIHSVIYKESNGGKGSAVYTGIQGSNGDIVVIQDADMEYNPKDYAKLIELIVGGNAEVVYGSRFLGAKYEQFIPLSYLANKFLTFLTNLIYGTKLTDMETCYKAMKRKYVQNITIKSRKFDLEPEITAKLVKQGADIKEVPVSYNARSYNEGKKITYKDGLQAIFALIKYKFID